jgi:hypothetical protein
MRKTVEYTQGVYIIPLMAVHIARAVEEDR